MRTLLALLIALPLVAAGCVNAPEEIDAAAADAAAVAAATDAAVTPFTFDGSIGPIVYACPVVMCNGFAEGDRWTELPFEGETLTGFTLTMTWEAVGPAMESIRMGVAWGEESYEYVEGPSPLVLEAKDLAIAKGDEPYFWTWTTTQAPMGVASVATPQEFHVEGELTFAPAAVEAAPEEASA